MIFSASTVLDSPTTVTAFVRDNLAMGVDHMFVFLDNPHAPAQDEVRALLAANPHTTAIVCDDEWWGAERPDSLNRRQQFNANVAVWLVREHTDGWLFHFDVDEVLDADLDVLAEVPSRFNSVHLATLEAVSVYDLDRPETRFKTLVDDDTLRRLHEEGLIERPKIRAYFRGHVRGKSGVRPGSGATLAVHFSVDARGKVPSYTHPSLRILHHHTQSGPELAEKAIRMAAAGDVVYRDNKARVMAALAEVSASDRSESEKDRELRRIFDEYVADPVDRLEALGLLVHVDVAERAHRPAVLTEEQKGVIAERIESLRGESKVRFRYCDGDEAAYEPNSRPPRRQASAPKGEPASTSDEPSPGPESTAPSWGQRVRQRLGGRRSDSRA